MKTRLLRSRRTVYILAISLLVVLTLPAFSAFAWGRKPARYKRTEVVLEGLSLPWVVGQDWRGNIYFTEDFLDPDGNPEYSTLKKYDPCTREVTEIEEVSPLDGAWSWDVQFDFWGNMYYQVFSYDWSSIQIYKLGVHSDEPELLFGTGFPEVIYDMEVDWCGNVYFVTAPYGVPMSDVWKIPICSDTPEFLFDMPATIHCIQASPFLRDGIYFIAADPPNYRIMQYKCGELTEILLIDAAPESYGFLGYMTLSPFRGLYYLYRERSPAFWEPGYTGDHYGLIEIGQFTLKDLYYGIGPRIRASEYLDDTSVWVYGPPPSGGERLLRVYDPTGDVFFLYWPWIEGDPWLSAGSIMWLDARKGTLKEIFTIPTLDGSFGLDLYGNLYVFELYLGTLTCIYR